MASEIFVHWVTIRNSLPAPFHSFHSSLRTENFKFHHFCVHLQECVLINAYSTQYSDLKICLNWTQVTLAKGTLSRENGPYKNNFTWTFN